MLVIKFKLVRFEKALALQILEQNSYHNMRDGAPLAVRCLHVPEMSETRLAVRGNSKSEDLDVVTMTFANNADRDAHYDNVIESLRNWAAAAPPECLKQGENDVYEF